MTTEKQSGKLGRIIAKAWEDEAYKKRLLSDATAVLKEEGVQVPEGMTVNAFENSDTVYNLLIPPKPNASELSEDQLAAISASGSCWYEYFFCDSKTGIDLHIPCWRNLF